MTSGVTQRANFVSVALSTEKVGAAKIPQAPDFYSGSTLFKSGSG
jgi:hypothetical protein